MTPHPKRRPGPRPKLGPARQQALLAMFDEGEPALEIARQFGVSKATVYNVVRRLQRELQTKNPGV